MEGQGRYRCPDILWLGNVCRRARYRMDRSISSMTSEVNKKEGKMKEGIVCIDILVQDEKVTGLEVRAQAEYTYHLTTSSSSSSLPSLISNLSHLSSTPFLLLFTTSAVLTITSSHPIHKSQEMSRNEKRQDFPPVSSECPVVAEELTYRLPQSARLSTSRTSKSLRMSFDSLKKPSDTPRNVDKSKLR